MKPAVLPHATVGRLLGLIDAMAETHGPDDLCRLAERLRLELDELHPLIASILRALAADTPVDWGRWPELFDYDADDACILRTGEGTR